MDTQTRKNTVLQLRDSIGRDSLTPGQIRVLNSEINLLQPEQLVCSFLCSLHLLEIQATEKVRSFVCFVVCFGLKMSVAHKFTQIQLLKSNWV